MMAYCFVSICTCVSKHICESISSFQTNIYLQMSGVHGPPLHTGIQSMGHPYIPGYRAWATLTYRDTEHGPPLHAGIQSMGHPYMPGYRVWATLTCRDTEHGPPLHAGIQSMGHPYIPGYRAWATLTCRDTEHGHPYITGYRAWATLTCRDTEHGPPLHTGIQSMGHPYMPGYRAWATLTYRDTEHGPPLHAGIQIHSLTSKTKHQLASGHGNHWYIESPMITCLYVNHPCKISVNLKIYSLNIYRICRSFCSICL